MKKTTLWLTLGLLAINPLTPAATNNLHDDDDDDLAILERAVISQIEEKLAKVAAEIEKIKKKKDQLNNKKATCQVCDKVFNKKSMKAHMRSHTGEEPFTCNQCGKGFKTSSNKTTHQIGCTQSEEKKSTITPKTDTYSTKQPSIDAFNALLDDQKYTCVGRQLYSCNLCHKKTTKPSDMKEHFKVHNRKKEDGTLKPFLCQYCELYYFGKKNDLSMHINNFCLNASLPPDMSTPKSSTKNNIAVTTEEEEISSDDF